MRFFSPVRRGPPPQIGTIGLGLMRGNMTSRLPAWGHHAVAYATNRDSAAATRRLGNGARQRAHRGDGPGLIRPHFPEDTILEGGISNSKDSMRRAAPAGKPGIRCLEVGTSDGSWR